MHEPCFGVDLGFHSESGVHALQGEVHKISE